VGGDQPVPLRPLVQPLPPADLPAPAPLVPTTRPATVPEPRGLIYQKDAGSAKTVALPMANTLPKPLPEVPLPQEQTTQPPPTTGGTQPSTEMATVRLFQTLIQSKPPSVANIGLKTEAGVQRDITQDVERTPGMDRIQRETYTYFPTERDFPADYRPLFEELKRPYVPHSFPPSMERVEPAFVMHKRLLFHDANAERYGWDFGPWQPILSAALFYKDVAFMPYHIGTRPCQCYETSAGYCLPGDPVPYLLYPPELSLTGGLLQAGTVVGIAALFP
jgi:hypothetical protein